MNKFKAGDKIERIQGSFNQTEFGGIYVVKDHESYEHLRLQDLDGNTLKGSYDAVMFTLYSPPEEASIQYSDEELEVGDRIVFISGTGVGDDLAVYGDTGIIKRLDDGLARCEMDSGVTIDVLTHRLRKPLKEQTVTGVSLDEAVKGCKDIHQQIAELKAKASAYEAVMRKHGVKFI